MAVTAHLARATASADAATTFYGRWVGACAAAEFIGIGTAAATAVAMHAWMGEPASTPARLGTLATVALVGAVEGGALGFLQWRVLRERLPRLRALEWMTPTVLLAVGGWLAGMTPSLFFAPPETPSAPIAEPPLGAVLAIAALAGAAAGLAFGAAQWLVLRRHAVDASRWIWIHAPAWALAMPAIFLGAGLPTADWPPEAIAASGAAGGVLGGVLLGMVTGLVARRLEPWVDEDHWSLRGTVCAVTGANSGIGAEVALGLARLGADVVLLCRRPAEGARVRAAILAKHPDAAVTIVRCDLADAASIRRAAGYLLEGWTRLDVLVHSAGATFPHRTLTKDGVEATLAVDAVGPFLLNALLRERLEATHGRVIALTGISHRRAQVDVSDLQFANRPYDWLDASNQAQRCRWLLTTELARRAPDLTAMAVHPGAVLTEAQARLPRLARVLVHTLARPGFVRPEVGAIPVLRLAARPEVAGWSGRFFDRCTLARDRENPAIAAAVWHAFESFTAATADAPAPRPAAS
ncbi:MAG: SDR family NAD(P)-dependent oxidoreductase [Vicinamibacterales bacterium]